MEQLEQISEILSKIDSKEEVNYFLTELFTEKELNTLSKRWRILDMLNNHCTQREIAEKLKVSLCKVTRGAKVLKSNKSVAAKYLKG